MNQNRFKIFKGPFKRFYDFQQRRFHWFTHYIPLPPLGLVLVAKISRVSKAWSTAEATRASSVTKMPCFVIPYQVSVFSAYINVYV